MATLRKTHLVARIATKMQASLSHAQASLDAVLESTLEALAAGNRVVLTRFGTFEVRRIKARKSPVFGGGMKTVPAHKRVGFIPGAELAKAVKGRSKRRA